MGIFAKRFIPSRGRRLPRVRAGSPVRASEDASEACVQAAARRQWNKTFVFSKMFFPEKISGTSCFQMFR